MSLVVAIRHRPRDGLCSGSVRALPGATVHLHGRGQVDSLGLDPHLLLVSGTDGETLAAALQDDETVESWECESIQGRFVCTICPEPSWSPAVEWTTPHWEPIREVFATGWWYRTVQVNSREHLADLTAELAAANVEYEVESEHIRAPESTRRQLTAAQREAIAVAHDVGYFDIPRTHGLEAVAAELDITRQAAAERLRRAYRTLVEAHLPLEEANDAT